MKTKDIYTKWIDYCEDVVSETNKHEHLDEVAQNCSYAIYYSHAWDLVCSVREWDPELFDEVNEDATFCAPGNPTLLEHMTNAAYLMTHHKLEQIWEARNA